MDRVRQELREEAPLSQKPVVAEFMAGELLYFDTNISLNWAVVSAQKSDWDQSLSYLNRSLSFRSDHVSSRRLRARVQYMRKDLDSALVDLQILKSRFPLEIDWLRKNSPALANEPAFREIFAQPK